MGKCVITGLPTHNMWKGKQVLPALVKLAKKRISKNQYGTVRDHMLHIQREFKEDRQSWFKELEDEKITIEQYVALCNEWFKDQLERLK